MPISFTSTASTQVVRATEEPGDRSMPPVRITSVPPMAAMATALTWSETFIKFWAVMKRSVVKVIMITASTRAISGPTMKKRDSLLKFRIPCSWFLAGHFETAPEAMVSNSYSESSPAAAICRMDPSRTTAMRSLIASNSGKSELISRMLIPWRSAR